MIRLTHAQARGDADPVPHKVEEVDVIDALRTLVCEHLRYCHVADVMPCERIVLHSSFQCGMTHVKTYEGTEQEMTPLFRALHFMAFGVTPIATWTNATVHNALCEAGTSAWFLRDAEVELDPIELVELYYDAERVNLYRPMVSIDANWLAICAVSDYFKSAPFVGWDRDRVAMLVAVGCRDVDSFPRYLRHSEARLAGMLRYYYDLSHAIHCVAERNKAADVPMAVHKGIKTRVKK